MKQQLKKPTTELSVCAADLLKAGNLDTTEYLEWVSEEGYSHLHELEAVATCDDPRIYSLSERLKKVVSILEERKQRNTEAARRSA